MTAAPQRSLAAAMWSVVAQAARLNLGGESPYRVLVVMLSEIDVPEFTRTGKLISWPSLTRIRERTALSFSTISTQRTRLRRMGLIKCLNPDRAGPDQPNVYEIVDRPVHRVGAAQSPSLPERVAHARAMRRAHRLSGKRRDGSLVVSSWPDDTPLPLGMRRAD